MSAPRTPTGVYLVLDADVCRSAGHRPEAVAAAAVTAGVASVQLRAKRAGTRELLELTERLADAVSGRAMLLVNDRTDVVLGARSRGVRVDGVHLGQSDLPASVARELLGAEATIGVSAVSEKDVAAAVAGGAADHVGAGVFRMTATKRDAPAPLGATGLARVVGRCGLPVVAIGGLTAADARVVRRSGAAAMAVVSAVCAAADPGAAARDLVAAWDAADQASGLVAARDAAERSER